MSVEYNGPKKFVEYMEREIGDEYNEGIDNGDTGHPILNIKFQTGGTATTEKNGIFIEDLIIIAAAKLNQYNKQLPDRRNSMALTHLEEAVSALHMRKVEREHRGVYGTEKA